jgi:hypothetical protein
MGEMVCDRCDKASRASLREFHLGSRTCECGGRYQWYAADRDGDADDWERW